MAKQRKSAEDKLVEDIKEVESIHPAAKLLVEKASAFVDAQPSRNAQLREDMKIVLNSAVRALTVIETILGFEPSMGKAVAQVESAQKKGANDE